MFHHAPRRAFTLIELLVVLAIIGVLAAILFPVLSRARAAARSAVCLSNTRQIAIGLVGYADDNQGYLPSEESELSWDAMLVERLRNEEVLVCPGDPTTFGEQMGLSYAWRDSFEAPEEWASLEGKRIETARTNDLVMDFESDSGWHQVTMINAAAVDTSARTYTVLEFNANMARPATR
jgi:prepilin-type N-terminal cleavage/methylation domain-containing protein